MRDAESLIMEELAYIAPEGDGRPDWADVLTRAPVQRRRRRVVPLIVLAVLAIAVPTVALSSSVRGFLGLSPTPVLSSAKAVVSGRVGNGFYAHVWQSASTTGGRCLFTTYDHSATVPHVPGDWFGGGSCGPKSTKTIPLVSAAQPLTFTMSIERRLQGDPRKWVPPVVAGTVYSGLHVARVAVTWRGGGHDLTLRNNWFVGGGRPLYIPPLKKFPFTLVAYDTAGHVVAQKKLESPTLLLLHGGWKEFARKYHAWQHRKR